MTRAPGPRVAGARPPGTGERVLLACGAMGPPLFVVVFLAEGAVRPDYDPLRHPISSLSLGDSGWTQSLSFVVTGLLVVAFAIGLRPALRRLGFGIWVPVLIGLVGVGLVGAGFFPTDPISGYPPGTPPMPPVRSASGVLHDAFSTPVFTALPAACIVVGRRFARLGLRAWSRYSLATGVVFLVCFIVTSIGFGQNPTLMPVAGLLQRLTIVVGFAWLTALAVHLLRHPTADRSRTGMTR